MRCKIKYVQGLWLCILGMWPFSVCKLTWLQSFQVSLSLQHMKISILLPWQSIGHPAQQQLLLMPHYCHPCKYSLFQLRWRKWVMALCMQSILDWQGNTVPDTFSCVTVGHVDGVPCILDVWSRSSLYSCSYVLHTTPRSMEWSQEASVIWVHVKFPSSFTEQLLMGTKPGPKLLTGVASVCDIAN